MTRAFLACPCHAPLACTLNARLLTFDGRTIPVIYCNDDDLRCIYSAVTHKASSQAVVLRCKTLLHLLMINGEFLSTGHTVCMSSLEPLLSVRWGCHSDDLSSLAIMSDSWWQPEAPAHCFSRSNSRNRKPGVFRH